MSVPTSAIAGRDIVFDDVVNEGKHYACKSDNSLSRSNQMVMLLGVLNPRCPGKVIHFTALARLVQIAE